MAYKKNYDVIIVGGSYSGLSAAMALGRSLRQVLIIDSGRPCNAPTPYSHNFLTQDGNTPKQISDLGRKQVEMYDGFQFFEGTATAAEKVDNAFAVTTGSGDVFTAKKLIFATGVRDLMPDISGFAACWGISVLHCPYCHGYEVKHEKTAIIGNGDIAFEFAKMISHWTNDLTICTNGKPAFSDEQEAKLMSHHIRIIENPIEQLHHDNGYIRTVVFTDGGELPLRAIYAKLPFEQHCDIPRQLGCAFTDQNYIAVDPFQKTSVEGVFACGDNTTAMRTLSGAIGMGTMAGAMVNREIIYESF